MAMTCKILVGNTTFYHAWCKVAFQSTIPCMLSMHVEERLESDSLSTPNYQISIELLLDASLSGRYRVFLDMQALHAENAHR